MPVGKIVHCKKEPFDVYIGRSAPWLTQSKWSNPYSWEEGTAAEFMVSCRSEALAKFEEYVRNSEWHREHLHDLEGKILGCWCKPKYPCHGDVLAKLLAELEGVQQKPSLEFLHLDDF